MILNRIISESIGSTFISPHAGADLASPHDVDAVVAQRSPLSVKFAKKARHSLSLIGGPGAALCLDREASRNVREFEAVVVFVGVLAARTRGAEPTMSKIILGSLIIDSSFGRDALQDTHGDGRGMNPPASFCWWYALDAVTARFLFKSLYVGGRDCHQVIGDDEGILSALAVQKGRVGL